MKFLKNEELLKKIFIVFLMLQPILDIYILFTNEVVDFFKFSPSTIIRIFIICLLLIMIVLSIKFNKKYLWFIVYGIVLSIYFVFHHFNASMFKVTNVGTYNYSLTSELFYIIRMLLPFIIAFITYHINLNKKQIYKIFIYFTLIISATIVLTNITCLSFRSYSENFDLISSNFFNWFFPNNYTNVDLSSKGIFNSANQIGSILSILLPITIYYFFTMKDNKKLTSITLIFQTLSVLMIGTRISSYSWILIYMVMFILYIYYSLIVKKIKFVKNDFYSLLIIFLLFLFVLKFAPINTRKYASDYMDSIVSNEEKIKVQEKDLKLKIDNLLKEDENGEELKELLKKYISINYEVSSINKEYILDIYNYKADPVFWYKIMELPYQERCESRQIEEFVTARLYEINNNSKDKFLGMGFSTFRNGNLYLEQDFKVHFYTLGIIGSLLLVYPYIIILLMAAIYLIKNFKKNNLKFLSYCFSISLMVIFGYLAGSVLDQLIITLICGFIVGLICINLFSGGKND